jgi:phenylalanyl-tRNA synthetase alpha subunit
MGASKIVEKTGIAGGFGIDRMGMIKYGIDDIRKLFKNYDFKIIEEINKKGEEL